MGSFVVFILILLSLCRRSPKNASNRSSASDRRGADGFQDADIYGGNMDESYHHRAPKGASGAIATTARGAYEMVHTQDPLIVPGSLDDPDYDEEHVVMFADDR